ncbi:MAG: acylphosphatase [Pseudomonadota bacterium]
MTPVCKHLFIHGRVQGVYYRGSMVQEARRLGVAGWVRNRQDGTVEALAVGDVASVQALVDWAHRGPEQARVARVAVENVPHPGGLPGLFEQRDTL